MNTSLGRNSVQSVDCLNLLKSYCPAFYKNKIALSKISICIIFDSKISSGNLFNRNTHTNEYFFIAFFFIMAKICKQLIHTSVRTWVDKL